MQSDALLHWRCFQDAKAVPAGTLLGHATSACEVGVFMVDMLLILLYTVAFLWLMGMLTLTFLDVGSRKLQPAPKLLPFALCCRTPVHL